MNSLDYSQGEYLALASVFSDRLAIIDLPPEVWDVDAEPTALSPTTRQENELLKRPGEELKHAILLANRLRRDAKVP